MLGTFHCRSDLCCHVFMEFLQTLPVKTTRIEEAWETLSGPTWAAVFPLCQEHLMEPLGLLAGFFWYPFNFFETQLRVDTSTQASKISSGSEESETNFQLVLREEYVVQGVGSKCIAQRMLR